MLAEPLGVRPDSARRARRHAAAGLAGAALLTLLMAAPAPAVEYTAARKLGRGLAGMACGFLEIPGNIVKETRENGPGWGFSLGFVKGLGAVVVRELVGVYEFVSAPFEVPSGYRPIIAPEFPWSYFEEPPRRR